MEGALGHIRKGQTLPTGRAPQVETYEKASRNRYTTAQGLYDVRLAFDDLIEAGISTQVALALAGQGQQANSIFAAYDKDKEELEALQMGAVQMLAPTLSKFGPLGIREFEVFDLPFLFDDRAALRRVVEGPIGQRLFNILETKGIRGLAYWDNGFKMMSANRPIRVPADMRGLKVRIQGSKVIDEQMRTLGANPQVMSFSEMTQALQSGVVDGAENPPLNFYSQKVYEVQKHLAVTEHGYLGFAVIVNKRFWDSLPPEIRSGLEAAIVEATQMNNALTERESAEAMQAIAKTGKTAIYKPTSQELALWRQALLPVHKKMEDRIGKDLLASVYKALGKEPER
jgi:C4-dicarboxylate-binding protein DctP